MKIIYLLACLLLITPTILAHGQAPANPPAQQPPALEGIAMLGFQKGLGNIPIDGTTLSVYAEESLWVVAKQDVSVLFGIRGQQARAQQVRAGDDLQLALPVIACCGNTQEFELSVSSGSISERAKIILVGEERLSDLDASVSVNPAGIEIIPRSSAKTPIKHIALMKPGAENVSVSGYHGTLLYRDVVRPQSVLRLRYSPPQLTDPSRMTVFFVIESPRVYTNEGEKIVITKNGTVAAVSSKLPQQGNDLLVEIEIPAIGSIGNDGDTPLRPGLNFLHIYLVEEEGGADIYAYLPMFVIEDDNYTILDVTNSKNKVSLPLAEQPPIRLVVYASTALNGIATATASKEIMLPVSRIMVSNGRDPVNDYTVFVEPDVPKANIQGITYLLSTRPDLLVTLTKLKVSNFTVSEFSVNGSDSKTIGFPQDVQITTKILPLRIDASDEFGANIVGATFKVRRNDEHYAGTLLKSQSILLPSGTYTIDISVNGILAETRTITIDSAPQIVTLVINRLSTIDRGITAAILAEVAIVIVIAIMLLRKSRKGGSEEEDVDSSEIPLRHVD